MGASFTKSSGFAEFLIVIHELSFLGEGPKVELLHSVQAETLGCCAVHFTIARSCHAINQRGLVLEFQITLDRCLRWVEVRLLHAFEPRFLHSGALPSLAMLEFEIIETIDFGCSLFEFYSLISD
jgi:hypothetical protein